MTKREKLRNKLRSNPSAATMHDVETMLGHFGFSLVRIRGSHHVFEYDDGERTMQIIVPMHGRKVKSAYVKRVIELIDGLFPESSEDSGVGQE
ncbi:MAG: type II toxin-antitoxin system HicA family toxin [Anaerolineae bacterium]|nr:type II toxin-antitoxin system HicA family toxin [Anaerolineae bacterium]NUQ05565.1 type II toxin-antitoxin system HicA family toxin [Anaerolineae bacterium]